LTIRAAKAVDKVQQGTPEGALKYVVDRCAALMA